MSKVAILCANICFALGGICTAWAWLGQAATPLLTVEAVAAQMHAVPSGEGGRQVVHWRINNRRPDPVRLEALVTDCGCTVVKRAPREIAANSEAEVVTERSYEGSREAARDYGLHVQYIEAGGKELETISSTLSSHELSLLCN